MKKTLIIVAVLLLVALGLYTIGKNETGNVENGGNADQKADLIRITNPRPGDEVRNPLTVTGEARGYWYFEASFPLTLVDDAGVEVAVGHAEAQGEWMTEEFVPFIGTLTFTEAPTTATGQLMLHKDNPSGLPEHDDVLIVPIIFETRP